MMVTTVHSKACMGWYVISLSAIANYVYFGISNGYILLSSVWFLQGQMDFFRTPTSFTYGIRVSLPDIVFTQLGMILLVFS